MPDIMVNNTLLDVMIKIANVMMATYEPTIRSICLIDIYIILLKVLLKVIVLIVFMVSEVIGDATAYTISRHEQRHDKLNHHAA